MSDPVLTERVKLAASALNTLATASMTVAVLAPSAAILYGVSTPTAPAWELALGAAIWVSSAAALHYGAQRLLVEIAAMISAQTYLLFVAPFVMGLGGFVIYAIADRFTRAGRRAPAE